MNNKKEKILIIDDSILQARGLINLLDEEYETVFCDRGRAGLEKASQCDPSLILLDVVMPDMDGFQVLGELKENSQTKDIPVIMITGLSDVGNEEKGLTMGAVDYIAKPFNPVIARARVRTHIQLYLYQRMIKTQAMIDELTGLPNRRNYDERSQMEWGRAIRSKNPLSIVLLDIDYFKQYNDTYGHPAGDLALSQVARTISAGLRRTSDFAGRYGGEEFVILIPENDAMSAFEMVKKIRISVEKMHIRHDHSIVSEWITVSAGGITTVPRKEVNYETCLKIADTMLYDAKRLGRNQVVWSNANVRQWTE